jgi:hypothetical protein
VVRTDGSVHSSVVNAGPIAHPVSGKDSLTFRRGWQWAGVEGPASIVDSDADAGESSLAAVLRDVFAAAGGTYDDWDEYDRVMASEGRVAIFVEPSRVLGN